MSIRFGTCLEYKSKKILDWVRFNSFFTFTNTKVLKISRNVRSAKAKRGDISCERRVREKELFGECLSVDQRQKCRYRALFGSKDRYPRNQKRWSWNLDLFEALESDDPGSFRGRFDSGTFPARPWRDLNAHEARAGAIGLEEGDASEISDVDTSVAGETSFAFLFSSSVAEIVMNLIGN